jgi:hypothetical protein
MCAKSVFSNYATKCFRQTLAIDPLFEFPHNINRTVLQELREARPWKEYFKSDLRSDPDHLLKKDLRLDQDHICSKVILSFYQDQRSFFAPNVP